MQKKYLLVTLVEPSDIIELCGYYSFEFLSIDIANICLFIRKEYCLNNMFAFEADEFDKDAYESLMKAIKITAKAYRCAWRNVIRDMSE